MCNALLRACMIRLSNLYDLSWSPVGQVRTRHKVASTCSLGLSLESPGGRSLVLCVHLAAERLLELSTLRPSACSNYPRQQTKGAKPKFDRCGRSPYRLTCLSFVPYRGKPETALSRSPVNFSLLSSSGRGATATNKHERAATHHSS